jgi:hypothetical protein
MKKPCFLILIMVMTFLQSCQKNQPPMGEEITNHLQEGCFTEEAFMSIAQGFAGFWSQFRDTSFLSIQTKLDNLQNATDTFSSPIPLSILAGIYEQELLIDSSNVAPFLSTLVEFKDIISAEGFSQCFYDELVIRAGEDAFYPNGNSVESRWFLSTLASALGAGPCITGPMAIIDTCAYIATGVLTAPTGVGAVANWGGAVASYGYAMSTVRQKC